MAKTKVMIVDDSAVVRQVLTAELSKVPDIEVIGAVQDPLFAMERMRKEWPDVLVLDIEMPRMDGLTFLKKIMAERPTPVVICSTLTEQGAQVTLDALSAGAVAYFTKSKVGLRSFLEESAGSLITAVQTAARAKVRARTVRVPSVPPQAPSSPPVRASQPPPRALRPVGQAGMSATGIQTTERVVAIGASTGGVQALEAVLRELPQSMTRHNGLMPGIVVVQHMPERFTRVFAERLDKVCAMTVREAADGDRVLPGHALIAPGGRHLRLQRSGTHYLVDVKDGPLVSRHKPSVDVLFRSVAQLGGRNSVLGIIMTGMGDDGATGMLEMHTAGCPTIAESEETCAVYGMPKEAVRRGAVDVVMPLHHIARAICDFADGKPPRAAAQART